MDEKQSHIADEVLKRIGSGNVRMHSKLYFALGTMFVFFGTFLIVFTALYAIDLFSYNLRHHSPIHFLGFGLGGVMPFLEIFPWVPFGIALIGIAVGVILLRRYSFGYRFPAIAFIGASVAVCGIIGVAIDMVGLNNLGERTEILKSFYSVHFFGGSWATGIVRSETDTMLILETPQREQVQIILEKTTKIDPPAKIQVGEWVHAIGQSNDNKALEATAVSHTASLSEFCGYSGEAEYGDFDECTNR